MSKVLAVSAGGQGIGRAIGYRFAAAGYSVSIADMAQDAGEEACAKLQADGHDALFVKTDMGRPADIERWLQRTERKLGCPTVLVNNAGIMKRTPVLSLSLEDFERVIAVNLKGAFVASQIVARRMVEHGIRGSIVNMASTRAFMSEPDTESYAASKGGIVALTHAMAISLGPKGVRVNAIAPGWIETSDWQYSERATKPRHTKRDREQHPVGRVGTPEDIAAACLFLAEEAPFMTGQTITIDGGMTVKMIYEE